MKLLFQVGFFTLVALSLYLSLTPFPEGMQPIQVSDKIIHTFAYFCFFLCLDFSYRPGKSIFAKAIVVVLYSSLIELAQDYVDGRQASMFDIFANCAGVAVFMILVPLFKKFRIYQRLALL